MIRCSSCLTPPTTVSELCVLEAHPYRPLCVECELAIYGHVSPEGRFRKRTGSTGPLHPWQAARRERFGARGFDQPNRDLSRQLRRLDRAIRDAERRNNHSY